MLRRSEWCFKFYCAIEVLDMLLCRSEPYYTARSQSASPYINFATLCAGSRLDDHGKHSRRYCRRRVIISCSRLP